MAATISFSESNLPGEVVEDNISNLNFGSSDEPNLVPADNKILVGENSYEKYIRIKVEGSGWTEISNMKFWKYSGNYLTDELVKAASNQTYSTPLDTTSSKAIAAIPTDVGSALDIQSTEIDTSIFTTPGYSKYIVLQLQTSESTPAGAGNTKSFAFQYDEE